MFLKEHFQLKDLRDLPRCAADIAIYCQAYNFHSVASTCTELRCPGRVTKLELVETSDGAKRCRACNKRYSSLPPIFKGLKGNSFRNAGPTRLFLNFNDLRKTWRYLPSSTSTFKQSELRKYSQEYSFPQRRYSLYLKDPHDNIDVSWSNYGNILLDNIVRLFQI